MAEITNPILVTDVEKDSITDKQEKTLVANFIDACLTGNLQKVTEQLNKKK